MTKKIIICLFFLGLSGLLFAEEGTSDTGDLELDEEQLSALDQASESSSDEAEKLQREARREAEARMRRAMQERRQRDPFLQFGFQFEDVFTVKSEMMWNTLTLRPWAVIRLGDNASLRLSVDFSFPWDEQNGWGDMFIEPGENMLFITSGNDWLKLGRIHFYDPLNVVANGLFDGIELSLSSLQLGAFYTGFRNKETANIFLSRDDLFDYADDDVVFAPQRVIGSAQYKLLDNHDSYFLVGALAQYDLRDTPFPVDTYYAFSQIHIDGYFTSVNLGAAASFLKIGHDPYKIGIAASADFYRKLGNARWVMGLQWFSGTINSKITPFVPVTANASSSNLAWLFADKGGSDSNVSYPSLWVPRLSFIYSVDNAVSMNVSSRWLIRGDFESFSDIDYSDWKVDIGLTVSTAPSPSSSSGSSRRSYIDFHLPLSMGIYFQAVRPSAFSSGSTIQLGPEIDLGSFMTLALIGEVGMGFGLVPLNVEGYAGAMGEVYFANKRLGFGMGYGYYGNLTTEDVNSLSYINYALIFRRDHGKTTLYAKNFSDNTWGIGVLFSFTADIL